MSKRQEKKTKTLQRRVELLRAEYMYVLSKIVAEYSHYVEEIEPLQFEQVPYHWVSREERLEKGFGRLNEILPKNIDDIFMELEDLYFNQE